MALFRCLGEAGASICAIQHCFEKESEMNHIMASLAIGTLFLTAGAAFADSSGTKPAQNPTTGQRGAPTNTCGAPGTTTPGGSGTAQGAPFNPSGTAGTVYAGNPDTASLANSNSTAAVSQYDVACFQNRSQIP